MIATTEDPRAAELLRRRAERNGTSAPAVEPRKLDEAGKADVRFLAAENPKWSASEIADAFEAGHGWRPTPQGIGRALSDPAAPRSAPRKPRAVPSDPDAEVGAIAALSRALAPLSPEEVRRVLAWAQDRFEAGEGGGS